MTQSTITLGAVPTRLLTPSALMRIGYIQNNGSNECRLTFDGSSPSATKGFLLPSGMQVWLEQVYGNSMVGNAAPWPNIMGYSTAGTSIDLGTDDNASV